MKNKRKYKFTTGIQQIQMDSPDKSKLYNYQTERAGQDEMLSNSLNAFSGQYKGIGQIGGMAGDFAKSKIKNKKTGSTVGGALKMGASGAALGASIGGPWGAAIGGAAGLVVGGIRGKKEAEESAILEKEAQQEADTANFNKGFKEGASTDVQQFLKKGKYKLKTKEPRLIEYEGGELVLGPKEKNGKRKFIDYNPNDPKHEEGGVKALVMPTKKYNYGAKKIMSGRKYSKNPEIKPPTPYELMPKPEKSHYIKVYKEGSKGVSLAFSRGEKDPKGGLTQKGVDKYNRATGGNLKMAVTTPPSKLKPGSKAANRRKSFCARMSGVKGPMEKNGKPTRKALALRKWNC